MKWFKASPVDCVSNCPEVGFSGCESFKSNLEPFTEPGICLPCRNKPDSPFTQYLGPGDGVNNCPWTCSVPNLGTYSSSFYYQIAKVCVWRRESPGKILSYRPVAGPAGWNKRIVCLYSAESRSHDGLC